MKKRLLRFQALESRLVLSAAAEAAPHVLFIRGGDRTGGFLEANNDFGRTEQLADINNDATFNGNHGWAELRQTLESAGFAVKQITEGSETTSGPADGIAIDFASFNFTPYDAIVFGSNNAVYDTADVDAVEQYIRGGGAALFISDANFGGDWADASNSDQQFLDRFGLVAHQDQGTYSLTRSNPADFLEPDHPLFTDVDRIDGEGVTPIRLEDPGSAGVMATLLARAEGQTRLNEPPFSSNNQGPSRAAGANDAAVFVADAGDGKIAGHFDRNTFFNQNGAGTNINRFDNQQYALNLFGWLVGAFDELPGDYNSDGAVDDLDRQVWAAAYGDTGASPADGNGDGVVDAADYTVWRDNLGCSAPDVDLTLPATATAASQFVANLAPIVAEAGAPIGRSSYDSVAADSTVRSRDAALLLLATRQSTAIDELSSEEEAVAADSTADAAFEDWTPHSSVATSATALAKAL